MENIESNIKEHQILSVIQEIKEKLTQENIDLKKLNLECSCVNIIYVNKDRSLAKKDFLRISNKSEFDFSQIKFYKNLLNIQNKIKINQYDSIAKKICLYPKFGLNDKLSALTGKRLDLSYEGNLQEKDEMLVNKSEISVISLIESENKTSFSAIQKIIKCIEKNKSEFFYSDSNTNNNKNNTNNYYINNIKNINENKNQIKSRVQFYSLFAKRNEFYFMELKDLINEKNWGKYGDLFKFCYYIENYTLGLHPFEMFEFDTEEKEFFIVLDGEGIIRHLGKFSDYSLEDKIKEILKSGNNANEKINKNLNNNFNAEKQNENNENVNFENNKITASNKNNTTNKNDNININVKALTDKNQNQNFISNQKNFRSKKDLISISENKENQNSENIKNSESSIPKITIQSNFSEETEESYYTGDNYTNNNIHSLSHFTPYMNFKSNLSEIANLSINNKNNNENTNNNQTKQINQILEPINLNTFSSNSNFSNANSENNEKKTSLQILSNNNNNTTTISNNILSKLVKSFVSSALPITPQITNTNFDAFSAEFQKLYKQPYSPLAVNYLFFCEISKIFKHTVYLETLQLNPKKQKEAEAENFLDFQIKIECFAKEAYFISNLMQKFFTKEEVEKYNFSVKQIPNFSINVQSTTSCYLCQIVLSSAELQFYCVECQINFCPKCVQDCKSKFNGLGFESLVHKQHYLLVYQNPSKKNCENIAKFKLGNNLFAMFKEDNLRKEHNFSCDICGNSYNHQERFVCLTCRPGLLQSGGFTDICAKCFEKVHVEGQLSLLIKNMHKVDHVYLHMVFAGVNYYDF